MVTVKVSLRARLVVLTVIVEVPEPGAAIDVGLKLTVTPEGAPEAVSATAESKPPETVLVIVEVPELPLTMVREVGEALRAKLALAGAVTVRVTAVV